MHVKKFLTKYKWFILGIIILMIFLYPKKNGYKNYDDQGGYTEKKCSCLGYTHSFGFFSNTNYFCIGLPLSCTYHDEPPYSP